MVEQDLGLCPFGEDKVVGAKLGSVSFDEVDAVFRTLPEKRRLREGVKPHMFDRTVVVSRFSEDQYPYVRTMSAYLNGLVNGKVFGSVEESCPNFTDRIIRLYEQDADFVKACNNSELEILAEFAKYYPNLMPVVCAAFTKGTADFGLSITVPISLEAKLTEFKDKDKFHGSPISGPIVLGEEVECIGMAIAVSIATQTKEAAKMLDITIPIDNAETLGPGLVRQHVENLYQDVSRRHSRHTL